MMSYIKKIGCCDKNIYICDFGIHRMEFRYSYLLQIFLLLLLKSEASFSYHQNVGQFGTFS